MSRTSLHAHPAGFRSRQSGTVLFVVIVLLLLATVLSLFALNVGSFEQRTSGNDLRTKLLAQLADSAIAQGIEAINADPDLTDVGSGDWEVCDGADTTFPCGSMPAARRATMYRYVGGAFDVFGDGAVDAMDLRMLPLDRRIGTINNTTAGGVDGFAVQYGVGAVLCRLVPASVGTPAACTTNASVVTPVNAVSLVAVSSIPVEGARTTTLKTIVTYNLPGIGTDAPPILASGSVDLTGSLQIVTNANSAGPGVPVSIWTRRDADKTGTPNSCYADEFFRLGAKNNSPPTFYPAGADAEDQTLTCDDCSCPGDASLSFSDSGGACGEGMDILDVDNNTCGVNRDVVPSEFPCDLFQHVFGIASWKDTDGDFFCETKLLVDDPENVGVQIGVDENYLARHAAFIVPNGTAGFDARFVGDSRVVTCAQVGSTAVSGLVWDRTGDCADGRTIGTPANPTILVADGTGAYQNVKLFGVLFVRTTAAGPLDPDTGGTASLTLNAGSVIYGSAIVQGVVEKANGTAAIISDAKVLSNLSGGDKPPEVAGLPGSWSDSDRY